MRTDCIAHGKVLDALWQPDWEASPLKTGYVHAAQLTHFAVQHKHSTVKQLYPNAF